MKIDHQRSVRRGGAEEPCMQADSVRRREVDIFGGDRKLWRPIARRIAIREEHSIAFYVLGKQGQEHINDDEKDRRGTESSDHDALPRRIASTNRSTMPTTA